MTLVWTSLGVDRAIAFTVLNRTWMLAAAPVTLFFIVVFLSPLEQGFYYAFTSVLGLQVFFELGLSFVVMQTASHYVADRTAGSGPTVGGPEALLGRLLIDALQWYGVACLAFVAVAYAGGSWFLGLNAGSQEVAWQLAWSLVVPVFGLSIVANACFGFLEGIGFVDDVALARFVQAVLGTLCLWLLLAFDWKLMSLVALHALNLMIAVVWLLWRRGTLLRQLFRQRAPRGAIDWRRQIWPFQWRIAASWVAGYCGTQAITLIVFADLGPVEAGKFGLTLTALGAVATGASAWLTTKAPRLGGLAAQRRYAELDRLYHSALQAALIVGLAGVFGLIGVVAVLRTIEAAAADRFVPLAGLAAMALATLVHIRMAGQAAYLRAFRKEPFLTISIAIGVLQILVTSLLAQHGHITAAAFGYGAVVVVAGLWWAPHVFSRARRELTGR